MILFEYLAAAITLILSFAVVRLVAGLPSSLVPERRYWVQVVTIFVLFFSIIANFWAFWSCRDVEWTFSRFLLALAPHVLLQYLAATLIPSSPDDVQSWREVYFRVHRRFFVGWILYGAAVAANSSVLLGMSATEPARIVQAWILTYGGIGALSTHPKVHAGLAIGGVVASLVVVSVFASPGTLAR